MNATTLEAFLDFIRNLAIIFLGLFIFSATMLIIICIWAYPKYIGGG